jgi:hypothetical protein
VIKALDLLTCDSQDDVKFYSSPLFLREKMDLVITLMYIKQIGRLSMHPYLLKRNFFRLRKYDNQGEISWKCNVCFKYKNGKDEREILLFDRPSRHKRFRMDLFLL